MAAVLARKRQEEEMKAKKLQQIEEDHRMAQELFKQRQEKEVSIHDNNYTDVVEVSEIGPE